MTKYVCIEGGEGTFKTTTCRALAKHLRDMGFSVLETKEPGTTNVPLTMKLREMILDKLYDETMSREARELLTQAIRSLHLKNLIEPALGSGNFDYIIQDRGVLSGRFYAEACGNNPADVLMLEKFIGVDANSCPYDHVFIFHNEGGLDIAINAKNEFGSGDAMESRGEDFHLGVEKRFKEAKHSPELSHWNITDIDVHGKTRDQIVTECLEYLL